jgi:hypothetical protein
MLPWRPPAHPKPVAANTADKPALPGVLEQPEPAAAQLVRREVYSASASAIHRPVPSEVRQQPVALAWN